MSGWGSGEPFLQPPLSLSEPHNYRLSPLAGHWPRVPGWAAQLPPLAGHGPRVLAPTPGRTRRLSEQCSGSLVNAAVGFFWPVAGRGSRRCCALNPPPPPCAIGEQPELSPVTPLHPQELPVNLHIQSVNPRDPDCALLTCRQPLGALGPALVSSGLACPARPEESSMDRRLRALGPSCPPQVQQLGQIPPWGQARSSLAVSGHQ